MVSSSEIVIPVPWGHICGKTYGNPDGVRKVLVVHGWMDNCGTFDLLMPLIVSDNLYFVCIDLPGHGQSSHIPQGAVYHNYDGVTCIRRVINYLKWEKFDYIGHSMGAALGSIYASCFPDDVERLVMIDYAKHLSWENEQEVAAYPAYCREFLAIDRQRSGNFPVTPYPMSRLCGLYVMGTNGQVNEYQAKILLARGANQMEPNADKWTLSRDAGVRRFGIVNPSTTVLLKIFESMRCRLMVLKATESQWEEPQEVCEKAFAVYKESCKSFEYVEVPGNHFIPLTNPNAIAPHINRFLATDFN